MFMYEAPPPYPGIDPNLTSYPTPGGGASGYSGPPAYGGPPYPTGNAGPVNYGGMAASAPPFPSNANGGYPPQGCSAAGSFYKQHPNYNILDIL